MTKPTNPIPLNWQEKCSDKDYAVAFAETLLEENASLWIKFLKNERRWMLAQKALNKIDDGFEYRYGDEKARKFVREVLKEYMEAISKHEMV